MENYSRAAAFIDLDAIYGNLKALKGNTKKGTKLCAVLKVDGYGHGAAPIAKRVGGLVDFFALATIEEAINLRKNGITAPLLVLGHIQEEACEKAIREDIRLTVYDLKTAESLSRVAGCVGKPALIHIKLETGMNRLGFQSGEDTLDAVERISRLPGIRIEGLFSHFARADEADKVPSKKPYTVLSEFVKRLNERGITIPIKHM